MVGTEGRGWILPTEPYSHGFAMKFGRKAMRGLSYHRILAGTALALILAAPTSVYAQSPTSLDAAVPMPDAAILAPPTITDVSAEPRSPQPPSAAKAPIEPAAEAPAIANVVNESGSEAS